MTLIADRISNIRPSPTIAVSELARALRAQGREVFDLGVGEPDTLTPPHAKVAAIRAIEGDLTRYTQTDGTPSLKQAISEKFRRDNDLVYEPQQITVGSGAKQVIYNAMLATLDPGDEVIVPSPCWVSYPDIVLLAGGKPVLVPCSSENQFKLLASDLAIAITAKSKWIILNSPNNPTGSVYTEEELVAIAAVVAKHPQLHVLSDDIYENIVYDDFRYTTIAQVDPTLMERVLTVNGIAKGYAMTGWRIGFAGGPETLIKAMAKIQSQTTFCPSSISQIAAEAALTGPQDFLRSQAESFKERRDIVLEQMQRIPGLDCIKPDGAFYVFPCLANLLGSRQAGGQMIESDRDFVSYLLETEGVATVPGSAFGDEQHFRISYAVPEPTLRESCRRIEHACRLLT